MVVQCNSTLAELRVEEDPLWPAHSGITFHELGLGLSIIFGLISIIVAFYLIYRHATHYLVPSQQKHIIRILLMIPIYSTVSFLSVLYYTHAVYFQVLRDCYEAFAIASFFALMCEYVAPGLHEQKKFFRTLTPVNWFWGVFFMQKCTGGEHRGPFRKPRSGLTWFNVVWAGVFQYCLVRVTFTIVSVITEAFGRYCEHSLNPAFAHVWVICIEGASVTVAMFCLVQFYIQLKEKLSEYRPALKIICIKLVIFFSFWQTMVISFLASSSGPLKPTAKISYPDIYIGIPSWLLCIEMAFFAILHVFAFPWKPYSLIHGAAAYTSSGHSLEDGAPATLPTSSRRYRGFWYAIADSFNPWDVVKASSRGLRWMFVRYKHRHTDSSYERPAATYKLGASTGEIGNGGAAAGLTVPVTAGLHQTHSNTSAVPASTGPYNGMTTEDDRAGLLYSSMRPGKSPSPPPPPRSPFGDEFAHHDSTAVGLHPGNTGRMQQYDAHAPSRARSPFDDEYAHGDDGAAVGLDHGHTGRVQQYGAHDPPNVWQNDTSYRDTHPGILRPGQRNEQ